MRSLFTSQQKLTQCRLLLSDYLEGEISTTAVRNNLHTCAQRLESELGEENGAYIEGCPRDWEKLPRPDLPLVVGMDGGYVRSYDKKLKQPGNERSHGWEEYKS